MSRRGVLVCFCVCVRFCFFLFLLLTDLEPGPIVRSLARVAINNKAKKKQMKYQDMKQVVTLLDSLEGFENYAYVNESIREVKRDDNLEICEIVFACGYLKRTVANFTTFVAENRQTAWVLGYDDNILGVFLVD